jgi:hypothetical protein
MSGRCGSAAKQSPHRPGISRALGLRARSDGVVILSRTDSRKETTMWFHSLLSARRSRIRRPRRQSTSRPRLETLEDRDCPSCTFYQDGATLVGRGDASDDTVAFLDHQTGVIDVTCDGRTQTFRGIIRIDFQDLGGNNGLFQFYAPEDPSLPGNMPADFSADMFGDGQNLITLNALAGLFSPDGRGTWNIDIRATGAGNNTVMADFGPIINGVCVNWSTAFGAGNDTFLTTFVGASSSDVPAGAVNLVAMMGDGNDRASVAINNSNNGPLPHVVVTDLDLTLDGGNGSDLLSGTYGTGVYYGAQTFNLLGGPDTRTFLRADGCDFRAHTSFAQTGGNNSIIDNGRTAARQDITQVGDYAAVMGIILEESVASGAAVNVSQSSGDLGANQAELSWGGIPADAMVTASQRVGNDGSNVMGWSNDLAARATAAIRQVGGNGSRNSLTQTETIDGTMTANQSIGNDGSNFYGWNWHVGTGGSATANLTGGKGSTNNAICVNLIVAPGGTADVTEGSDSKSGSNNLVVGPDSRIAGVASFSETGAHGIVVIGGTVEHGGSLLGMQTGSDLAIIINVDIADGGLGRFSQEGSRLQFSYAGLLDGGLQHCATGTDGNDQVSARFMIDAASTGVLDSLIRLGDGNDRVADYVYFVNADGSLDGTTHGRLRSFDAEAFGDAGRDTFAGTANVQRQGFER